MGLFDLCHALNLLKFNLLYKKKKFCTFIRFVSLFKARGIINSWKYITHFMYKLGLCGLIIMFLISLW